MSSNARRLSLSVALTMASVGVAGQVPAGYRLFVLPPPVTGAHCAANAINDDGLILGGERLGTPTEPAHAWLWQASAPTVEPTDLGLLPGGRYSDGLAVANDGLLVGWGDVAPRQYRGFYTYDGRTLSPLAPLPGGARGSYATAASSAPERAPLVAGWSYTTDAYHACLWTLTDPTSPADLGTLPGDVTSQAWGLNVHGQVVGWSGDGDGRRREAFRFDPEERTMVALGMLPGGVTSEAHAINAAGQVTGWSHVPCSPAPTGDDTGDVPCRVSHAFFYDPDADRLLDLGTLGGEESHGRAINDAGLVVGDAQAAANLRRAFVWSPADRRMYDLNDLLVTPSADSFTLDVARGINASGAIVGEGTLLTATGTVSRAFLLMPVP
jgi:probable HAF family extracellular repeat protein